LHCGTKFYCFPCEKGLRKYCSPKCFSESRRGKLASERLRTKLGEISKSRSHCVVCGGFLNKDGSHVCPLPKRFLITKEDLEKRREHRRDYDRKWKVGRWERLLRLDEKRRIVIPNSIRNKLGLSDGAQLVVEIKGDDIVRYRISTEEGGANKREPLKDFLKS